jgi:hypothetical protein
VLYILNWLAVQWGCSRGLRVPPSAATGGQVAAIAASLIVATAGAVALGPFGSANFTHQRKVAASAVFRSVSEWHPSYSHVGDYFPPMWRFWWIAALTATGVLLLWLAGRTLARPAAGAAPAQPVAPWNLFDVAVVLIALCMTLQSRRFAPLLYVLAAPVVALWTVNLTASLGSSPRAAGARALEGVALIAAVVTGWITWTTAQRELVQPYRGRPAPGLLERMRGYPALDEVLRFMRERRLEVNLFTDYGDGGSVMFHAPLARVFIDGRGEQLYTEQHYRRYIEMMNPRTSAGQLRRTLDATRTDAVLVRRSDSAKALRSALQSSAEWTPVFRNADFELFLRQGSPALARLRERPAAPSAPAAR